MTAEEFSVKTEAEQVGRIKAASGAALTEYSLKDAQLILIQHGMNTVFWVEVDGVRRYVLRVHPDVWLDEEAILAETEILEELARESSLLVALPVRTADGNLTCKTKRGELPQARNCVLFHAIEHSFFDAPLDAQNLTQAGVSLAKLHRFGESLPERLLAKRPVWNYATLFGENGLYRAAACDPYLTKEQKEVTLIALSIFERELNKLMTEAECGFVHGDYYYNNLFWTGSEVGIIDFDMCGRGPLLFDLILPYWPKGQGDLDEAYRHFLRGYETVRPLPEEFCKYRPMFEAVRQMMEAAWVCIRDDLPGLRPYRERILAKTAEKLQEFIRL